MGLCLQILNRGRRHCEQEMGLGMWCKGWQCPLCAGLGYTVACLNNPVVCGGGAWLGPGASSPWVCIAIQAKEKSAAARIVRVR